MNKNWARDMREAQITHSQIVYLEGVIEDKRSKGEPHAQESQDLFSAITRLNDLVAGI